MATIPYTENARATALGTIITITWSPLAGASSDVGEPYALGGVPDVAVQLLGTLGTFVLEGCNEMTPVNYHGLTNEAHTAIDATGGARIEQILQSPVWIRPRVAGAASGVSVILTFRKGPR